MVDTIPEIYFLPSLPTLITFLGLSSLVWFFGIKFAGKLLKQSIFTGRAGLSIASIGSLAFCYLLTQLSILHAKQLVQHQAELAEKVTIYNSDSKELEGHFVYLRGARNALIAGEVLDGEIVGVRIFQADRYSAYTKR